MHPFCRSAIVLAAVLLLCRVTHAQDELTEDQRADINRTLSDLQPEPELDDTPTLEPQTVIGVIEGDAPVVVTPTRTELRPTEFGGTVRVIGNDEIQRSGETMLAPLLRRVAGVDVVQSGPTGGLTSVFLRGANSQHTKVFMDGIPLNDPSNASRLFDFSNFLLDDVERIEILQGPQSVLYGSDAIGGVINVITKRGQGPPQGTVSLYGGSFNTHREAASVLGGTDNYHYSFTGSWNQTKGFSAASPRVGGVERDGFEAGTATGRMGWTPSDVFELDYSFRWIDSRSEIDDASFALGAPPTDDPTRLNLSENMFQRVGLRRSTLDDLIIHRASFALADYDREDVDDIFPTTFAGQTRRFLYQADLQLTETNLLSAGADYVAEDGSSDGVFGAAGATQNDAGTFVQDQIQIVERWFTTVGFRWDDHSVAGSAKTYRVTSLFDVWESGTRIRGSIGTGFRAPSLAENLFPFGNPGLRPETSKGWEYGFDQDLFDGNVTLGATYFRNDFQNLILFDLATFTLQNIGQARTHGTEVIGSWNISPVLLLTSTYTVMDTYDAETMQPLVRRPRHKGSMALTRRLLSDRASLTLYGLFVDERTDARDASVVLDDYAVFNLAGDWQVRDNVRLFGRIQNLFDEDYEEITGFQAQPLGAFAGLDWQL